MTTATIKQHLAISIWACLIPDRLLHCRLSTLLLAVPENAEHVAEFSSFIDARQRAANLAAFKDGQRPVLMASDGMARGMDVVRTSLLHLPAKREPTTRLHRSACFRSHARAHQSYQIVCSAPNDAWLSLC